MRSDDWDDKEEEERREELISGKQRVIPHACNIVNMKELFPLPISPIHSTLTSPSILESSLLILEIRDCFVSSNRYVVTNRRGLALLPALALSLSSLSLSSLSLSSLFVSSLSFSAFFSSDDDDDVVVDDEEEGRLVSEEGVKDKDSTERAT